MGLGTLRQTQATVPALELGEFTLQVGEILLFPQGLSTLPNGQHGNRRGRALLAVMMLRPCLSHTYTIKDSFPSRVVRGHGQCERLSKLDINNAPSFYPDVYPIEKQTRKRTLNVKKC